MGNLVAPEIIRRKSSSSDRRLKKLSTANAACLHTHRETVEQQTPSAM